MPKNQYGRSGALFAENFVSVMKLKSYKSSKTHLDKLSHFTLEKTALLRVEAFSPRSNNVSGIYLRLGSSQAFDSWAIYSTFIVEIN